MNTLKSILLIGFFVFIALNVKIFEKYDDSGYDDNVFYHCSDSSQLSHSNTEMNVRSHGYGFNNNYLRTKNDISYKGGEGDFSDFLTSYKLRKEPHGLNAPICKHKMKFEGNLNIPSYFREIFQAGDSRELLNVEEQYSKLTNDPFDALRDPRQIKTKLILDDDTNKMILRQHGERSGEGKHNNHIEINEFIKTCQHHSSTGQSYTCGTRGSNPNTSMSRCEDDVTSDISCAKICCNEVQESFNIN